VTVAISLAELEEAVNSRSPEKRLSTLRGITDLFLNEADRLNEQQIAVFDDVLVHLIQRIEARARVELSATLAPLANAPIEVVRRLAHDDEVDVATPVLTRSARLTESDLISVARSKGQGHLLAISGRSSLSEALTDVLVERGDHQVSHRLARNSGARFSEGGLSSLAERAAGDATLAETLAARIDLPLLMLQQLLARATDVVRSRLLALASPEKRDQIHEALASISNRISHEVDKPRDFRASETVVQQLNRSGKLNEQVLADFINERKYEETASVLALFCGAPVELIERLMKNIRPEGLITACKAAKLTWPTVSNLLTMRFSHHSVSAQELNDARKAFLALSQAAAQRTLRFMMLHAKDAKAVRSADLSLPHAATSVKVATI
jgi:uncharacterized protein (DUF2336 family)